MEDFQFMIKRRWILIEVVVLPRFMSSHSSLTLLGQFLMSYNNLLTLRRVVNLISTKHTTVFLIAFYVVFFSPAGAVSSVMNEIFTLSARSSAFVIGGIIIWLGLAFTGMIFPFAVVCNLLQISSSTLNLNCFSRLVWTGSKMKFL